MLGLVGVTEIEDSKDVTARVWLPETVPEVEVMVAVPAAMVVTKPLSLTVGTDGFDESQVTCVAISRLVLSEYVPEAANCWVVPTGMLGLAGVTDMEVSLLDGPVPPLTPFPTTPHGVTIMAPKPKNNIAKKNLIFLTGKFIKKIRQVKLIYFRFLLKRIFMR